MNELRPTLTLYSPATYQIKIPGQLDESWVEWAENLEITIETNQDGDPITTLISTIDQAALIGILRRLYSLGLPLISVAYQEAE